MAAARLLMRWHRRVGVVAAVFVLLLACTGIAVGHGDALGLARRELHARWLLRWYGIEPATLQAAQQVGVHWLSQWGARLYLDDRPLDAPPAEQLRGAAAVGELLLLADRHQALLFDARGQLVDTLPYPAGFVAARIGRPSEPGSSALVLEDADSRRLATDASAAAFTAAPARLPVQWLPATEALPQALQARIEASGAGAHVTLERVLLDLHSGRLLGRFGPWLVDAAAAALVMLAATGAWTVLCRR